MRQGIGAGSHEGISFGQKIQGLAKQVVRTAWSRIKNGNPGENSPLGEKNKVIL